MYLGETITRYILHQPPLDDSHDDLLAGRPRPRLRPPPAWPSCVTRAPSTSFCTSGLLAYPVAVSGCVKLGTMPGQAKPRFSWTSARSRLSLSKTCSSLPLLWPLPMIHPGQLVSRRPFPFSPSRRAVFSSACLMALAPFPIFRARAAFLSPVPFPSHERWMDGWSLLAN